MKRKPIAVYVGEYGTTVACDDGSVWFQGVVDDVWIRLKDIPQDDDPDSVTISRGTAKWIANELEIISEHEEWPGSRSPFKDAAEKIRAALGEKE